MYTFIDRSRLYDNIDSILVCLGHNINICGCISCHFLSVGTDIISTFRNFMQTRNLLK